MGDVVMQMVPLVFLCLRVRREKIDVLLDTNSQVANTNFDGGIKTKGAIIRAIKQN